jgi:hypothetical protein
VTLNEVGVSIDIQRVNNGCDQSIVNTLLPLFESSLTAQLTVVAPIPKVLPSSGVHVVVTVLLQSSVALMPNDVTKAVHTPTSVSCTMSDGGDGDTTGPVSSLIVTRNVHSSEKNHTINACMTIRNTFIPLLPESSVAVHVTVVSPNANLLLDAGEH